MASFEVPAPRPDQNPSFDVPLPDVVDDAWCAMFNEAYGRRGWRAIVNTYVVLRQARGLYGCSGLPAPRSFYEENLGEVPEDGLFFDGEVLGVRVVPILDEWAGDFEYITHLAMTDVVDVEGRRAIALPHEEIWVPLTENGDTILLYS